MKRNYLIIILMVGTVSFETMATFQPARCGTLGDSVSQEDAPGRRAWAQKCYPQYRGIIAFNSRIRDASTGAERDGYPVIAKVDDNGVPSNPENWFAPKVESAPCNYPQGYFIIAYCVSGCYTPEQALLFTNGYQPIAAAQQQNSKEITTLSSSADLDKLDYTVSPIDYFVTDLVPGFHKILAITTASGGVIRITENHPLVDGEGRMRSAHSLTLKDSLVRQDGSLDRIIHIFPEEYFGKVYNVEVKGGNLVEKIIVAQGFLNGSLHYQNQGLADLNRIILRTNLISEALVK